jgi:hypothetical protein
MGFLRLPLLRTVPTQPAAVMVTSLVMTTRMGSVMVPAVVMMTMMTSLMGISLMRMRMGSVTGTLRARGMPAVTSRLVEMLAATLLTQVMVEERRRKGRR